MQILLCSLYCYKGQLVHMDLCSPSRNDVYLGFHRECHHWAAAVFACECVYAFFRSVFETESVVYRPKPHWSRVHGAFETAKPYFSSDRVFPLFSKAMKRNTPAGKDDK